MKHFFIKVLNEKIYRISDNSVCTVAGITADANILINKLRFWAANYKYQYSEPIPCEQLVKILCDEKQRYTQVGGFFLILLKFFNFYYR